MSKQANPTVIGGFVLGALALVVAGILIFSSAAWFKQRVAIPLDPTLQRRGKPRRSGVASPPGPLERPRRHSHTERGNEKRPSLRRRMHRGSTAALNLREARRVSISRP
jgi:hypothetical protein